MFRFERVVQITVLCEGPVAPTPAIWTSRTAARPVSSTGEGGPLQGPPGLEVVQPGPEEVEPRGTPVQGCAKVLEHLGRPGRHPGLWGQPRPARGYGLRSWLEPAGPRESGTRFLGRAGGKRFFAEKVYLGGQSRICLLH